MKNISYVVAVFLLAGSYEVVAQENVANNEADLQKEFAPLTDPYATVSGAYYGIGVSANAFSSKYSIKEAPAGSNVPQNKKQSKTLPAFSLLAGFGSTIYKSLYTGIEFDIFYRLKGGKNSNDNPIRTKSYSGFNMDVKFGYQLPKYSSLLYVTAGFARVLGQVSFDAGRTTSTYGTFHPTIGVGIVKKINDSWNFMVDLKYIIASKDNNKEYHAASGRYVYDAKPQNLSIRLAITKQI